MAAGNSVILRFLGDNKGLKDTIDDSDKALNRFGGSIVPLAAALGGTAGAGVAAFAAISAAALGAAAAMGGIGVAAAAQAPEVQSAFAGIGDGLKAQVAAASAGYVPLLTRFAGDIRSVIDGPVAGALTRGVERSMPAVERLLADLPGIVEDLVPVIDSFTAAGGPLLELFVSGLAPAVDALTSSLEPLGPAVTAAGAAIDPGLGDGLTRLLAAIGPLLEALIALGGPVLGALLPPVLAVAGAILESLTPAVEGLTPTITMLAGWLGTLVGWLEPLAPLIIALGLAYAVWTAAQWAINIAMTANPIGLIIVGIGLLVAAVALIATKTTWFQDAWRVSWNFIKDTALSVAGWVTDRWNQVVGFITGLPGRIRSAASGMWDGVKDSFRSALNWIIGKWNGLGFTLPSITAFGQTIGGTRISVPDIPYFHSGGVIPGAPGTEVPIMAMAGERVEPIRAVGGPAPAEPIDIVIRGDGTDTARVLIELLRPALRGNGVRIAGWT